jgi:hypothetical protein
MMVRRSSQIWSYLTPNRKAFMKLVSLKIQCSHRSATLDKSSRSNHASFADTTAVPRHIDTYAALRRQIHDDLRVQHPEWIQADGKSPMCDSYEARLIQVLGSTTQRISREAIVDPHRLLEQGAH